MASPHSRRRVLLALLGGTIVTAVGGFLAVSGVLVIRAEEVHAHAGEARLAGLFARPRFGSGPFPAVVVVHGSGRDTRETLRGFIARLVPAGFAVLAPDKRGTGESGGVYEQGLEEAERIFGVLAEDVGAWTDYLRSRPDVDPEHIGLVGGSQAGWVMSLAAAEDPEIDFVVVLSGPAVTLGEEDYFSELTGDDPGTHEPGDLSDDEIRALLAEYSGPAWFDPGPSIERMSASSLWILGGRDRSVPTRLCRQRLDDLRSSGRANAEILWIAEGDHDLRDAHGARIDFWSGMLQWMRARVTAPGPGADH